MCFSSPSLLRLTTASSNQATTFPATLGASKTERTMTMRSFGAELVFAHPTTELGETVKNAYELL
ncbi:unnamed protein product [Thlaspi arvense]|uniref:Uncharacterized protein n=1 Tax=Thlaspi arvense TaxID=13288 RepID=A0AAU9RCR3_THLAR|nr:unnamed protein product [Thlaspi arvense]